MNYPKLFAFFLLGSSHFFLTPVVSVRAQSSIGDGGTVEFIGSLSAPIVESCSFSGAEVGTLGFNPSSKLVTSTKAAQIKAVIEPTDENPLSEFSIKAESPSLAYKSVNDTSEEYQNVQLNDLGIGLDDENGDAELGIDTVIYKPTSLTSDLFVGVEFETESDLLAGDYQAVSSLSCFITAN